MKRFLISEEEKRRILGLHKSYLNEQTEEAPLSLNATQKLEKIQSALKQNPDVIIGPNTTNAIIDKLKGYKPENSKKKYACVVNHNHVQIIDYDDSEKLDYQIGDLVFSMDGTYIDLSPNTSEKFTYSCDNDIINTSKHGYIRKDMYPEGSEEFKMFAQEPTTQQTTQQTNVQMPQSTQTNVEVPQSTQTGQDTTTMTKKEFKKMEKQQARDERERRREEIKKIRQAKREEIRNIRQGNK